MVEKKPRKKAPPKKAASKKEVVPEEPVVDPQVLAPILSGTAIPAYGTAPYADNQEVSGPPVVQPIVDVYRPFFPTDARSVMVILRPNHWNFIKNPSFRVNTTGWKAEMSLLDTAIWSVDASKGTATQLTDLSGGGKNAVFGGGAAAPTVLPWSGLDYVNIPAVAGNSLSISMSAGLAWTATRLDGTTTTGTHSSGTFTFSTAGQWQRITTANGAFVLDPHDVAANYATIANTGTAGGSWTINRSATGYKTAVVNRPLLLFGGAQTFTSSGSVTGGGTRLRSRRAFGGGGTIGTVQTTHTTGAPALSGVTEEYLGEAVWDRVLSAAEITEVSADMAAGLTAVTEIDALDAEDSWVGKSFALTGDGVLHYQDTDKNGKAAYVYVGPLDDIATDEYRESVRLSAAWTFSAYVKGTGRVRLVMEAYEAEELWTAGSPPINQSLKSVADPTTASYGDAKVASADGHVWTRNDPPFYLSLGSVPIAPVSPDQIKTSLLMAPVVVDDTGSIWELTSPYPTQASYYTKWGIPPLVAIPGDALPAAGKYIRDADGIIYHAISPTPSAIPYYESFTPPMHPRPEFLVPDRSLFPMYYIYGTNLWRTITPIPDVAPFYQLAGAITTLTTENPATMPPAGQYLKKTTAAVAGVSPAYDVVWTLKPKPYYTDTGTYKYLGRKVGDWLDYQNSADWERLVISTTAYRNADDNPVSFAGASWIDCRVEVEGAAPIKVSSLMLDADELVIAEYFDGAMTETEEMDDYLWAEPAKANNSVSWYYYDRRSRAEWLWQNLQRAIPVNRPLQIYFEDYTHPFTASGASVQMARATKQITL